MVSVVTLLIGDSGGYLADTQKELRKRVHRPDGTIAFSSRLRPARPCRAILNC